MKQFTKLFIAAILLVFMGCSSSDDSNDQQQQLSTQNSFSVTIDNVDYTFNTFFAYKTHDNYEVLGSNDNQENFYLRFNQNGVLDRANFYSTDFSLNINSTSSFYNAESSFNISNLTFDMSQNVVSANFSGTIYEDDLDVINGDSMNVQSGSFNLVFTENQVDANLDTFIDATVNGSLYETVKHGTSSSGSSVVELFGISDTTLVMSVYVDTNNVQVGTFDFTNTSIANKVSVEVVDPFNQTNNFEQLDVTGTLVIDNIIDGAAFDLLQGTFSVTASSANGDVYTITNGTFNLSL